MVEKIISEEDMLELSSLIEGGASYLVRDRSSGDEKDLYRLSGSCSQSCSSQNSACSIRNRDYENVL